MRPSPHRFRSKLAGFCAARRATASFLLAGLLGGCATPSRWAQPVSELDGVINLLASRDAAGGRPAVDLFTIHRDTRRCLVLPGSKNFTVKVPRDARLTLAFGVDQESWAHPATPVRYQVAIEDSGSSLLWQGEVDPTRNPQDQAWREGDLRLGRWSGKEVTLRLSASGGLREGGGTARCGFATPRIKTASRGARRDAAGQHLPNILLFVIDTLRADHLSGYGYRRRTSPSLDRLASEGAAFAAVVSPSSWTKSSVASILTATYPFVHRANGYDSVLPGAARTLPEVLRSYGYLCAGLIANTNVGAMFGFAQGFDSYRLFLGYQEPYQRTIAQIWPQLERWLRLHADERFFLYLHTVDPHVPYDPPTPYLERFCRRGALQVFTEKMQSAINDGRWTPTAAELAEIIDLYDGEIAFTDAYFQRLDRLLTELGLRENTIVAVTSDHGEQFLEHGSITHGITLFEEEIHVPLILRYPGRIAAGQRLPIRVQALDLMPTLLELARIQPPSDLDGRSLADLLEGGRSQAENRRQVASDGAAYSELELDGREIQALLHGPYKLVVHPKLEDALLFNLARDPGEQAGSAAGERLKSMRAELAKLRGSHAPLVEVPQRRKLDEEQLRLLRALGYAQ